MIRDSILGSGNRIFSSPKCLDWLWGPETPVQWVLEVLFVGAKWPECEADYSRSSSVEFKKAWSWTLLLLVCFNRVDRGNFIFNSAEPICGNLMFV